MRRFVEKSAFVLMAAMTISQSVFAAEKNSLVKMDLNKVLYDTVRLNLYTSQPYEEQVFVNKKEDNTYTILLPETSNFITQQPIASTASDIITDIDVKTQQGVDKNYTKITIKSSIPIELIPSVRVVDIDAQRISDDEANNLIAESQKITPVTEQKSVNRKENIALNPQTTTSQKLENNKTVTSPIKSKTDTDTKIKTPTQKTSNEKISEVAKQSNKNTNNTNTSVTTKSNTHNPIALKKKENITQPEPLSPKLTNSKIFVTEETLNDSDSYALAGGPLQPEFEDSSSSGINFADPKVWGTPILLLLLLELFKKKKQNSTTQASKKRAASSKPKTKKIDKIVNDKNMSWNQKYKQYKNIEENQQQETYSTYDPNENIMLDELELSFQLREKYEGSQVQTIPPQPKEDIDLYQLFDTPDSEPVSNNTVEIPEAEEENNNKTESKISSTIEIAFPNSESEVIQTQIDQQNIPEIIEEKSKEISTQEDEDAIIDNLIASVGELLGTSIPDENEIIVNIDEIVPPQIIEQEALEKQTSVIKPENIVNSLDEINLDELDNELLENIEHDYIQQPEYSEQSEDVLVENFIEPDNIEIEDEQVIIQNTYEEITPLLNEVDDIINSDILEKNDEVLIPDYNNMDFEIDFSQPLEPINLFDDEQEEIDSLSVFDESAEGTIPLAQQVTEEDLIESDFVDDVISLSEVSDFSTTSTQTTEDFIKKYVPEDKIETVETLANALENNLIELETPLESTEEAFNFEDVQIFNEEEEEFNKQLNEDSKIELQKEIEQTITEDSLKDFEYTPQDPQDVFDFKLKTETEIVQFVEEPFDESVFEDLSAQYKEQIDKMEPLAQIQEEEEDSLKDFVFTPQNPAEVFNFESEDEDSLKDFIFVPQNPAEVFNFEDETEDNEDFVFIPQDPEEVFNFEDETENIDELLNKEIEIIEDNVSVEEELIIANSSQSQNTQTEDNINIIFETSIGEEKGFYLIEKNHKYSLIGHIKDEIFVLNTFDDITDISQLNARVNERIDESTNIYIVKTNKNKSLIKVSQNSMKWLMEL